MTSKYLRIIGLMILVGLVAASSFAQSTTTGAMTGRVTDANGPLPGVTVTLTSDALQGSKVAVTDTDGRFRFPSLPPGDYRMEATLSGFQTASRSNISVALGKVVTLDVTMSASFQEQITVSGTPPVVDVTSAKTGANISSEMFQTLPVQRSFYNLATIAPGVTTDAVGPTMSGSTGAENNYIIDGLNVTGMERGEQTKQLNFDFIQEVEVLTGGLPAEYGRMTGGVVNAITKSGGNEFKGEAFGYYAGGGLQADNSTADERPETTTSILNIDKDYDIGANVGGYFIKDRLWFFGAYDQEKISQERSIIRFISATSPPPGTIIPTDVTRDLYAGKLTLRINDSQSVYASVLGDPTTRDGAVFTPNGEPGTFNGTRDTGGADVVVRYNGVFGQKLLLNATAGRHHEEDITGGPGTLVPRYDDYRESPIAYSGGFGFYSNNKFDRDVYKLDATTFLGSHELKIGGDYEDQTAEIEAHQGGGGQRIYLFFSAARGGLYYRHRFYVNDRLPTFDRSDSSTWELLPALLVTPETKNTSVFVQDSWRVLPNLTLNAGIRWEQQKLLGREGVARINLNDNWAPRVGVIWDPTNNGRTKVFANFGRFYESIPMDINIRSFGGEATCFCYNRDPNPANYFPDDSVRRSSLLGGETPVDPDLKGQYVDEYLAGVEFELPSNVAVGVKGTYRKLGRVIEDFLAVGTGNYLIANPGSGLGSTVTFYDYYVDYDPVTRTAPAPKAQRTYKGLELTARKRFSNNYQFFASYVFSKLEGNYDGLFQNSTGQLDPNINSAYDYADFLVNAKGLLSNDRKHQLKLDGSYVFDESSVLDGATIGLSAHWYSGTPLTAYGYSFLYQNWEYYLTPRGSLGRAPADWEADVHLGYPINFGNGLQVSLIADVFNVFNRQAKIDLDQRYNLAKDDTCGGFPDPSLCNGDNGWDNIQGTTDPAGSFQNPRATATNVDFLKAGTAFTGQRSIRIGARLKF